MALQKINLGTAGNDGTGDAIRVAFSKVNDNFAELFGTTNESNDIIEDTTPQLGGNLDVNGKEILKGSGSNVTIEKLVLLDSSITPSTTNTHLTLAGTGTGKVSLSGLMYPSTDGASGQVLQTNGAGVLSWVNNAGGGGGSTGDLSIIGSTIASPSNANLTLDPGGTGNIILDAVTIHDNQISTNSSNANLELSGNGSGTVTVGGANVIQNLFATVSSDSGSTTANATTDTLTIAGGTGISTAVSGDTLTINASTTNQNLFQTVAVAGQSNVVADTATDTLTLAGATGITITTDAASDTITFTGPTLTSFATLTGSQTLTNKTLTTPIISSISNSGTVTLPTATDTLVGRATTDTLTNKTINGSNNTLSNIGNSSLSNSAITITGDDSTALSVPLGNGVQISGGAGIQTSVSGSNTVTITASGGAGSQNLFQTVNSDSGNTTANTTTDTLNVVGGTGIATAISGDTLTITASGGAGTQDLFKTVAGDSGSTTANSTTDTLTIAGGTGVTTSVSGDTLTINSTEAQNLFNKIIGDSGETTANSVTDTLTILGGTGISTAISGDTLTITSSATATNINTGGISIDDNEILGLRSNENIIIDPAGTGKVVVNSALEVNSLSAPTSLSGTYTISSPTTITLSPTSEIINLAPMKLLHKTVTQLQTFVASAGSIVAVSDAQYKPAYYDGSNWKYVGTDGNV